MSIPIRVDLPDETDRFARFRLIQWWDQRLLENARVLVAGAGAIGNELIKNLALLGIGNIFIIDLDTIENSNLTRSVLYREEDNGRPKAEIAAKTAKDIYQGTHALGFQGNLLSDLGLGVFRWADLVIAGLDNREARLSISRNCWRTRTPWIDGAIEGLNGIVRVFTPPEGPCYECTLSAKEKNLLKVRRSCNLLSRSDMLSGKVPTTPTSASIIAGIQCQEAIKLLHGLSVLNGKGFVFDGMFHNSYTVEYEKDDDCNGHESFEHIISLDKSVFTTSLREMVKFIQDRLGKDALLEFTQDIVCRFECKECDQSQRVFKPLSIITEREGRCPLCDNMRIPVLCHSLNGKEEYLDMSFSEFGIPPFDIVIGRSGFNQIFLEFSADKEHVLGSLVTSTGSERD